MDATNKDGFTQNEVKEIELSYNNVMCSESWDVILAVWKKLGKTLKRQGYDTADNLNDSKVLEYLYKRLK